MRILVSGFEAFLDEKVNPTEQLAQHVNSCAGHRFGELDVRGVVLPVLFADGFRRLERELALFSPDVVLSFGLAAGRKDFSIETVAVNRSGGSQTSRGDNAGVCAEGVILPDEPLALPSTLPVDAIVSELRARGVPASLSTSAGNYVCNEVFFRLQAKLRFSRVRSGFIHVPRLLAGGGDSGNETGLKWETLAQGLDAILSVVGCQT